MIIDSNALPALINGILMVGFANLAHIAFITWQEKKIWSRSYEIWLFVDRFSLLMAGIFSGRAIFEFILN